MKSKPKVMTALSIAQPWAQCVVQYGKNVENKSTNLKKRGTIAIYASNSYVKERFDICANELKINISFESVAKGAIVGFATVIDVIEPNQKKILKQYRKWWHPDSYGYVLENVILLKTPVPAKPPNGAISFWYLKGARLQKCLSQVSAAQLKTFIDWE